METGTITPPAPPDGYQLDAPPPPEGFVLDSSAPLSRDGATPPPGFTLDSTGPEMRAYHPTLAQRAGDLLHTLRTSGPVETLLGRTPEEIASAPALDSAPTTADAGAMGLFTNKKPVVTPYEQPVTALDGLHNWAAGVVNSLASPGGFATAPLTGPAKVMGPIVQKALLLTFGAQGAKMTYDAAKDLVTKNYTPPPPDGFQLDQPDNARNGAQTVEDIGNILAGGLMGLGGVHALKGERPAVQTPAARPADDWLPAQTPEAGAGAAPAAGEAPALPEQGTTPAATAAPAQIPVQVSTLAKQTFNDLNDARAPLPVSVLGQAGIAPETLAEGYALNPDGSAYEFTPPAEKVSPEQQMARDSVQAMADLRAAKGNADEASAGSGAGAAPAAPGAGALPEQGETPLLPVDVSPAEVKAAASTMDRADDILDAVKDNFPNGVRFHPEDQGDVVRSARGAAAQQMFVGKGEPADQVLKGLHESGLYPRLQTPDDLAEAMRDAGEARMAQRGPDSSAALELARQQKRTEMFEATALRPRAEAEAMPASQLFVGDTFKLNGQPVRVIGQVVDAETGRPSHVEVEGAYGRQNIAADAAVQMDAGSLESPSLGAAILGKLDSLKLDTNGQLHAFGLVPEVWNTLIEGVKLAVRGGMKLADAIEKGIATLRSSGANLKDFNEPAARLHLQETLGGRQFGEQLQASTDISDALKGGVTNTLYTRRPQEDDQAFAQRIVQTTGGPDQARAVFADQTNALPQPVRMAVGMQILKAFDAAGRHVDAANFFDNELAPHTTDVAQGLAMLNAWHAMSKDGKLDWARVKILRSANDAVAPVRPDIDAAKTELQRQNAAGVERATADPQVQAGAKAAITDAVVNSPETHAAVVMELTQPWASAKGILDIARQRVGAKANELLNKLPRPIGFLPADHLRAILDDLAKRAAEIAASHYQGAEPGVVLKDKLVQRLGISEDKALQLANALDKEFARQVAAAKDALPKRLAAQLERAKQGLPQNATETAVDRSIRQQLQQTKTNLGQLVREHWTKVDATGAELKDKLVKQAGLDPLGAERLADIIQRRFEALTAAAKRSALNQILKPLQKLGLAKTGMVDKLIKLSNVGAFDDAKYWNALRERLDLPEWNAKLKAELAGLADRIGRIPQDRIEDLQRAQTDFLNAVERAKGVSNLELSLAFYMQNILSGLTTHVRVAIHTSAQMVAATAAETAQAMVDGRLSDVPLIFEALGRGAGRALTQQKDIFRSGLVVGSKLQKVVPLSVLEQIHFGRKGGTTVKQGPIMRGLLENRAATILNLWKYNARLITAQHMIYFAPAEEMKLALLAARQARTEGLTGRDAVDRARQMLGYGAAQVRAAEAQALREGLESTRGKMRVAEILRAGVPAAMKETARDYALRQTFLNDPYGFAGTIANIVASAKNSEHPVVATAARVIVPFTRIAANLFNEGLNYTPVGAARARLARTQLLGHKFADITPEVRNDLQRELYAKSALGTMLLTAIAFQAARGLDQPNPSFTVYGAGPANPQDKEAWRAAGAIPYSVKINGRYLSYANTPANVMLATLGNYLDSTRDAALYKRPGAQRLAEDLPMRTAAATVGASKVILEQPFLQSLLDLAQLSGESNPEVAARGGVKTFARTASSFIVPNLLRQADRFYDPTLYDQRSLGGILTSQVPFVRQEGRPMLNALGQPIQSPVFGTFTSPRTADPLVQTLTDLNAWPSTPDRNRTAVNGVPLNDEEFYLYVRTRGQALASMLAQPAAKPMLTALQSQTESLNQRAATEPNPVAQAKLKQVATTLQTKLLERYTAAADKMASAAVIRQRGY